MSFWIFICVASLAIALNVECIDEIHLDSNYSDREIKRIAFGSCNNLKYPFDYFQHIIDQEPDVWLWTGDIVYGKTKHGTDISVVADNYKILKSHPLYQQFIASNTIIDGVYDDHDIGVNDADNRLLPEIQSQSQNLLLDFLDIDSNDPRRSRHGAYSVHKMGDTMIIMLDSRTHRSPTIIPSIGKWEFPFFAFIASYIRYLTAFIGMVNEYKGTVLGEEQWRWLEQVVHSKAFETSKLVLIVSSTQVFTSNPYFESWGHFPSEKYRLVDVLENAVNGGDIQQHLLLISGDVHHSELIYGTAEYGPLEVTSSGLTHSLDGMKGLLGLKRIAALQITETYHPLHRTRYLDDDNVLNGYYGRNFGVIDIIDGNDYELKIYDAASGEIVIKVALNRDSKVTAKEILSKMKQEGRMIFQRKYPFYGMEWIFAIITLLALCVHLYRRNQSKSAKKMPRKIA